MASNQVINRSATIAVVIHPERARIPVLIWLMIFIASLAGCTRNRVSDKPSSSKNSKANNIEVGYITGTLYWCTGTKGRLVIIARDRFPITETEDLSDGVGTTGEEKNYRLPVRPGDYFVYVVDDVDSNGVYDPSAGEVCLVHCTGTLFNPTLAKVQVEKDKTITDITSFVGQDFVHLKDETTK